MAKRFWQHSARFTLTGLVLFLLLWNIFSPLHLWLHQQIQLATLSNTSSICISKDIWQNQTHEITLNGHRFDIHSVKQSGNQITLLGEWDLLEDDILKGKPVQDKKNSISYGISPFLFCNDLPILNLYQCLPLKSVAEDKTRCFYLERNDSPKYPPPDKA